MKWTNDWVHVRPVLRPMHEGLSCRTGIISTRKRKDESLSHKKLIENRKRVQAHTAHMIDVSDDVNTGETTIKKEHKCKFIKLSQHIEVYSITTPCSTKACNLGLIN